jgi:ABC-type lipoprotein export system ATPase subunit
VEAVKDISLQVNNGEFVVIKGPSGSGKTTLLMLISSMLKPTTGSVWFDDTRVDKLSQIEKTKFRAENIGFVFQMFYLIPYLDVLDNVLLTGAKKRTDKNISEAERLLGNFGLAARLHHFPSQLSAGEQQRVATARALFNNPKVILADEPTGNLDPENAAEIVKYLTNFAAVGGIVLLATHQKQSFTEKDRIISLPSNRDVNH